jgi:hypothetical protein
MESQKKPNFRTVDFNDKHYNEHHLLIQNNIKKSKFVH